MSELDDLARQAVGGITRLAGLAAGFAGRILLLATVACVGGFLLGVAALTGGIETVWIVLGIVFGSIAIGGAFTAWWRVRSVRRHAPELVGEIRTLVEQDGGARRTVVETFVVDPDAADPSAGSAIVLSRQMSGFERSAGADLVSRPRLSAAIRALTTYPFLLLAAVAISAVFAFLGFIFLIALAL